MIKTGCPYCSGLVPLVGVNDLATTHPNVAKLVIDGDPTKVSAGSHRVLVFACPIGHPPRRVRVIGYVGGSLRNGTKHGVGCLYCANKKVLAGYNDLATTHPEIAVLVLDADPTTFTAGSERRVLFACPYGKHSPSQALVVGRTRPGAGAGCPSCCDYGYQRTKPGTLYLIRNTDAGILKVGISNNMTLRLQVHGRIGFDTVVDTRRFKDGEKTLLIEGQIKHMIKNMKIKHGVAATIDGLPFIGHTESWPESLLPVTSLTELMRLAKAAR